MPAAPSGPRIPTAPSAPLSSHERPVDGAENRVSMRDREPLLEIREGRGSHRRQFIAVLQELESRRRGLVYVPRLEEITGHTVPDQVGHTHNPWRQDRKPVRQRLLND